MLLLTLCEAWELSLKCERSFYLWCVRTSFVLVALAGWLHQLRSEPPLALYNTASICKSMVSCRYLQLAGGHLCTEEYLCLSRLSKSHFKIWIIHPLPSQRRNISPPHCNPLQDCWPSPTPHAALHTTLGLIWLCSSSLFFSRRWMVRDWRRTPKLFKHFWVWTCKSFCVQGCFYRTCYWSLKQSQLWSDANKGV